MAAPSSAAAAPAPAPVSPDERWPPLESSPDVFNQLMWSLGVPEDVAEFHDVYSLDADALEMVPRPVLAVIFCFPDPTQDASNPSQHVLVTGEKETLFFIKQIESLGNACGTIALIHAVGNAYPEISLLKNSSLDTFAKSSSGMTSYERAMFLEKDDDMARAHSVAASAGDTKLSDDVEEHYICFVECDGTLYELDGMKPGPIKHGSSSPESLLQDAVNIIKATMHNIPNSVKFNVMVLSRKAEQYGAIIPDN
ncbi:ubiquitin carboxyl-terminal hydrolase 3-like isoform X1 [Oryza brachyantha]|uniref:Ubiquitin carboxyl-terminal hydrolase n=1 Tax=Oryza brachyantha TaxID=4533 RepID=J3M2F6_ORYBR|nr:ubiquitin carboxyl-terminal hydrolase 3-like isoform X1 [Oryza brachyantha]